MDKHEAEIKRYPASFWLSVARSIREREARS